MDESDALDRMDVVTATTRLEVWRSRTRLIGHAGEFEPGDADAGDAGAGAARYPARLADVSASPARTESARRSTINQKQTLVPLDV